MIMMGYSVAPYKADIYDANRDEITKWPLNIQNKFFFCGTNQPFENKFGMNILYYIVYINCSSWKFKMANTAGLDIIGPFIYVKIREKKIKFFS